MIFHYPCGCKVEIDRDGEGIAKVGRMFFCQRHRTVPDIRDRAIKKCLPKYHELMKTFKKFNPS